MNDGTMPTDPVATPPVDNGMGGAPAMDPPVMPTTPPATDDGGMGAAPAADPAMPPADGGDMGTAPEVPAMPAEGEAAPADDVPAPM